MRKSKTNKRAPLKKYKEKRNFQRTPEPEGKKYKSSAEPIFVIQKHDASHLHYDFRLEVNGALKSWVIPKGPSIDPTIKRLAIPVEDHPLEYAYFEGVIPEGNYGAGEVMVWDIGTYINLTQEDGNIKSMLDCIENGFIEFELHGKKLKGTFALIRTGFGKELWLLVKKKEASKVRSADPIKTQIRSALTNRTLEQIARAASKKR